MGYFYGIFAYGDNEVSVYRTALTQAQLTRELASISYDLHDDAAKWGFEYAPGWTFDAWENETDGKLYLTEAMARGVGERHKRKRDAYLARACRAEHLGRRKKIEYYIEARARRKTFVPLDTQHQPAKIKCEP